MLYWLVYNIRSDFNKLILARGANLTEIRIACTLILAATDTKTLCTLDSYFKFHFVLLVLFQTSV